MAAKLLFPLLVLVGCVVLAGLTGNGWPLILMVILCGLGIVDAFSEHKKVNTKMTAWQWFWASGLGLHVQYSDRRELKPRKVSLPQTLAAIKLVLVKWHRGTDFWRIDHVDEPTGFIKATFEFKTDPVRPDDKTTTNTIILIIEVSVAETGDSVVRADYEFSTNYLRRKECEAIMNDLSATIEDGLKTLENPHSRVSAG